MGAWKTAEALGLLMDETPVDNNAANALFIEPWRNKNDEYKPPLIVNALRERGVNVRQISAGANLNDFINAPGAGLNLVLSSLTQPLAINMKKNFGAPYANLHNSFSVDETDGVYKDISVTFNIDFENEFDGWRSLAVKLEERAKKELNGLKYVILGADMPVALCLYLSRFGMEPLLLNVEDFHPEDLSFAKKIKEYGYDPYVCRMMNYDRDIEIIRRMRPDICFGNLPDPPVVTDGLISAEEMGDFFGIVGYERTAGILSRIFNVLETGKTGERMDMHGPAPL